MFLVLFTHLSMSFGADMTSDFSLKVSPKTSSPVTNERVEAGLRKIRNARRTSPEFQRKDVPIHLRLANILSQQGDPNGAIEEYQVSIQLNPDMAEAYRGMEAVYLDKHEWILAEDALERSSRIDQADGRMWFWLGRILLAQRKFSEAAEALTRGPN